MSVPVEIDFAQIKMGNAADPEVFTVICDITSVSINETAETSTRRVRDCTKPNKPAGRRSRVLGTAWDVTGSGLSSADQIATLKAAVGRHKNYEIVGYRDDGTDAGEEIGTWSGQAVMTARNYSIDREGDTGMEITLEGEGDLTYVAA
ncbi:hypothetical protein [Sphingomonas soli]|uniref:hypothetical protein n=1 Tax=Sphingomonas soli TaxID=266127 RepID=UPI000829EA91|nr:hypothetical protein [Sphingomonas soli]